MVLWLLTTHNIPSFKSKHVFDKIIIAYYLQNAREKFKKIWKTILNGK